MTIDPKTNEHEAKFGTGLNHTIRAVRARVEGVTPGRAEIWITGFIGNTCPTSSGKVVECGHFLPKSASVQVNP